MDILQSFLKSILNPLATCPQIAPKHDWNVRSLLLPGKAARIDPFQFSTVGPCLHTQSAMKHKQWLVRDRNGWETYVDQNANLLFLQCPCYLHMSHGKVFQNEDVPNLHLCDRLAMPNRRWHHQNHYQRVFLQIYEVFFVSWNSFVSTDSRDCFMRSNEQLFVNVFHCLGDVSTKSWFWISDARVPIRMAFQAKICPGDMFCNVMFFICPTTTPNDRKTLSFSLSQYLGRRLGHIKIPQKMVLLRKST